jgi:hypothetical protein
MADMICHMVYELLMSILRKITARGDEEKIHTVIA